VVSAVTGIVKKNYENTENMEIKPVCGTQRSGKVGIWEGDSNRAGDDSVWTYFYQQRWRGFFHSL
jgi:hypothetical protein